MLGFKPYAGRHRADGPSTMQLSAHKLRMHRQQDFMRRPPVIPGPEGAAKPVETAVEPQTRVDYTPQRQETPEPSTVKADYPWPEKRISYNVMDIPSNLW